MGFAEAYTRALSPRWVRALIFTVWLAVMGGGVYMFTIVPEYTITALTAEQAKPNSPVRTAKEHIVSSFDTLQSLQTLLILVESTNGQPVNGTSLTHFSNHLWDSLERSDFFRWQQPDSLVLYVLGYEYMMRQNLSAVALSFISKNLTTSVITMQFASAIPVRERSRIFPNLKHILDNYTASSPGSGINVSATGSLGFDHDIRTQSTHNLILYVALITVPISFIVLMPLPYLFGPNGVTIAAHLGMIEGIVAIASSLGSMLLLGVLAHLGFTIISFGVEVMTTLTFFVGFDWALILYEEYVSAVPLAAASGSAQEDQTDSPQVPLTGVSAMLAAPGGGQAVLLSATGITLSLLIMLLCPSPILANSAVCALCGLVPSLLCVLTLLPAILLTFNPVNMCLYTWLRNTFERFNFFVTFRLLGLKYLRTVFSSRLLSTSCFLLTLMLTAVSVWSLSNLTISYDNLRYVGATAPTKKCVERIREKFMKGYDGQALMMLAPVHTNKTVYARYPAVKDAAFWKSAQEFVKDIYDDSPEGSLIGSAFYAKTDMFTPVKQLDVLELDACELLPPDKRIGPLKMCGDLLWGWQEMVSPDQDATWVQIIPNIEDGGADSLEWTRNLRNRTAAAVSNGKFRLAEVWSVTAMSLDVGDGLYSDLRLFVPIMIVAIAVLFALVFKSVGPAVVVIVHLFVVLGSALGITWFCFGSLPWALPPILIVPIMAIPLTHDAIFFGRAHGTKGGLLAVADVHASLQRFSLCTNLCKAGAFSGMMLASSEVLQMIFVGLGSALLIQQTLVRGLVLPALLALGGNLHWWLHLYESPVTEDASQLINDATCAEAGGS